MAEHAVMLMLSLNRKLIHFNNITKNGNWAGNSHGVDLFEMKNKVLGIIGFGNIGKTVAKICSGFDMKVIYFDTIKLSKKEERLHNVSYASKTNLLKKSDIISLHLHLNSKTKNLINKKNIKILKKNAIIINVSRANLIEKKAIQIALKNKIVAGFGLDVHYEEPTIKNDEVLNHPNVVSTPILPGQL